MPDGLWIPFTSAPLRVFPPGFSRFQSKATPKTGELLYHHSLLLQVPFPDQTGLSRASRNALLFLLLTTLGSVRYLVLCSRTSPRRVCGCHTGLAPHTELLCEAQ